ncbi:hypothetical protein [Nostoc sp. C057]|nr:hypothetical protein [Nostoc sp. C057]
MRASYWLSYYWRIQRSLPWYYLIYVVKDSPYSSLNPSANTKFNPHNA